MKNILFVDDEPMVLRGIERSLSHRSKEWTMRFASSGAKALEALAAGPCDVVVTDMRMPGMTGAELLVEVMKHYPSVARIVLSGQADQKLVLQCVTTAHQYLSKPCEPVALIAAVSRMLELQVLMQSEGLRSLIARLDRLPSCPDLYRKITTALALPNVELHDIGAIVEKDMAMTAKLLKIVNSAFFGLSHHVDSAAEAVNYLGIEVLKSLILTVRFFDCGRQMERAGLNADALWRQAALTASAARVIARMENQPSALQENAYTAGMLHNCGLLIMAENIPESLAEVITDARKHNAPLGSFERQRYGATDAEIGGYLLGLWGLPMSIVESVIFHSTAVVAGGPRCFGTPTIVHAAQCLVGERIKTIEGVPTNPLNIEWLTELGLADRVPEWRQAVAEIIEGPN